MAKPNRRKALPPVDPQTDRKVRPFLEAIKELLETGDGVRGDPMDRKLTVRDLVESGLAKFRRGASGGTLVPGDALDREDSPNMATPPRPQDFNAIGSFGYIVLRWRLGSDQYRNHALTNIYRSETDNFANATLIGRDTGMMYTDQIRNVANTGVGYYYWITHVSDTGVEGPPNAPNGTYAELIPDVGFVMDQISGRIDEQVLTPAFNDRLNGLQTTLSEQGDRYTLSLTNNGVVTGYSSYNTGDGNTTFAVLAKNFVVTDDFGNNQRVPFTVVNGITYIDTAMIREASIQEGQLGNITFGKVKDASGQSISVVSGKIQANSIDTNNLHVASSARFSGDVYSSNWVYQKSGWAILQDGRFFINGSSAEGRVEHNHDGMQVYDSAGTLRVKMGRL